MNTQKTYTILVTGTTEVNIKASSPEEAIAIIEDVCMAEDYEEASKQLTPEQLFALREISNWEVELDESSTLLDPKGIDQKKSEEFGNQL